VCPAPLKPDNSCDDIKIDKTIFRDDFEKEWVWKPLPGTVNKGAISGEEFHSGSHSLRLSLDSHTLSGVHTTIEQIESGYEAITVEGLGMLTNPSPDTKGYILYGVEFSDGTHSHSQKLVFTGNTWQYNCVRFIPTKPIKSIFLRPTLENSKFPAFFDEIAVILDSKTKPKFKYEEIFYNRKCGNFVHFSLLETKKIDFYLEIEEETRLPVPWSIVVISVVSLGCVYILYSMLYRRLRGKHTPNKAR